MALPTLDRIVVAALGRQIVDLAHDRLPVAAVRADAGAVELVGDQMGDLVGHGLAQEVFAVLAIQLGVEAQAVLVEMGDAGLEAAQAQADFGAGETAVEEALGLQEAGLDTGEQLFGHGRVHGKGRTIMPWPTGKQQSRPQAAQVTACSC